MAPSPAAFPPNKPTVKTPLAPLLSLLLLVGAFSPAELRAQAPKIFVASFGNDANDGSRNAPKRNFQPAHDAVAAGGQIVVLDTAGYGALSITKSLAITVPPGVSGFVTIANGTNGINISAGSTDTVSLQGLIVEGGSSSPANGINAGSVGTLEIVDCLVRRFNNGVNFTPTNNAALRMDNTTCRECGNVGLLAGPFGSFAVRALITDCRFLSNVLGVNVSGIFASGTNSSNVTLADCALTDNSWIGLASDGATSTVRVDRCRIVGNFNGLANNGGALLSLGNNTLTGNTNGDGAFTGTFAPK